MSLPVTAESLFGPDPLRKNPINSALFKRWMRENEITTTPQKFGAGGTGSTDDTDAIQAALNSRGGASALAVYFPAGYYVVTRPLELFSATRIIGESWTNTRIQFAGGAAKQFLQARDGGYYSGAIFMHTKKVDGSAGLGNNSIENIEIEMLTGNVVDNYVFADAPTFKIRQVFFRGTRKPENAFIRTAPGTQQVGGLITDCLMRGVPTKGGNYQNGEFDNLENEPPRGIDVGSSQTLVIRDNFIQNVETPIWHKLAAGAVSAATVLVTGNRLEIGFNSNNPDAVGLYLDSQHVAGGSFFVVRDNYFELGPADNIGTGNPAPNRAIKVVKARMAHILDNWFSSQTAATYGSDNGPYFVEIAQTTAGDILDAIVENNHFRTRNFPIRVAGQPDVRIGRNYSNRPNGPGVEYDHAPGTIGRLEVNEATPFIGDADWYVTANTSATVITDLLGGRDAKVVFVVVNDTNTSITVSSSGAIRGGAWAPVGTIAIPRFTILQFVWVQGWWYLIAPLPAPVLTGTRSDYNPPSLAAGESDSFTITVTGAAIGDHVSVAPSASIGTLMKDAGVSGTNTVTVKLFNPPDAPAAVDLAALVWTAKVTKK